MFLQPQHAKRSLFLSKKDKMAITFANLLSTYYCYKNVHN